MYKFKVLSLKCEMRYEWEKKVIQDANWKKIIIVMIIAIINTSLLVSNLNILAVEGVKEPLIKVGLEYKGKLE